MTQIQYKESDLINIFKKLKLDEYDIIYVASSGFAHFWDANFEKKIIKALKLVCNTLIMPSFSFDFCDKGFYSVKSSKTFCGKISEMFLQDPETVRTKYSPMHNVTIYGKEKDYFNKKQYYSSFGEQSIFADMSNFKCGVLLIDCSFDDGCAFIHCLEDKYKSNYRHKKIFTGQIIDSDGVAFKYNFGRDVRDKNVVLSSVELGKMFYKTELVTTIRYCKSEFAFFSLNDFYSFFNPIFKNNPEVMRKSEN